MLHSSRELSVSEVDSELIWPRISPLESVLVSFITLISGCCTLASVVIIASIVFGERGSRRLRMCCLIPIQLVLSDPLFQDRRVLERVSQVCESNHRRGP